MIDVNCAGVDELKKVKGIGPVIARSIVKRREKVSGFNRLEELLDVKGIGEKKLEMIRDSVLINRGDKDKKKVTIEFDPDRYGLGELGEVHLVGSMNKWNPSDRSYPLRCGDDGIWRNTFNLAPGVEYKIMYDSSDWNDEKHIGDCGQNFVLK